MIILLLAVIDSTNIVNNVWLVNCYKYGIIGLHLLFYVPFFIVLLKHVRKHTPLTILNGLREELYKQLASQRHRQNAVSIDQIRLLT